MDSFWLSEGLAEAGTNPEPFSASKTSNWVARKGGLPTFFQHVAHDLVEKRGFTISRAIATAVSQAKKWAAKGNKQAAKAVAQWEKMKATEGLTEAEAVEFAVEDFGTVLQVAFGQLVEGKVDAHGHYHGGDGKFVSLGGLGPSHMYDKTHVPALKAAIESNRSARKHAPSTWHEEQLDGEHEILKGNLAAASGSDPVPVRVPSRPVAKGPVTADVEGLRPGKTVAVAGGGLVKRTADGFVASRGGKTTKTRSAATALLIAKGRM